MVGKTVGKYRIVDRIGRGGMGIVYKAIDETLDREVAIKVLNPEHADAAVVKRFRAEAMTLARLNHPGIATIYELLRMDDDLLMVMEFVRGETLDRMVERTGPLPVGRATSLIAQVLDSLGHAHRVGIVHRDLKPANLMMTDYGSVKIMDFGIARVLGSEHLTSDGLMMGTPAYMAPEQVLANEIDARADLYSVGVVLYRLLSGNLPFKADTAIAMAHKQLKDPPTPLRQFRAEMPVWCEELLSRALAKSPADRFQTAEEFRDALVARGASLVPVAHTAPALETTLPPDRVMSSAPAVGPIAPEASDSAYAPTLPPTATPPTAPSSPPTPSSPTTPTLLPQTTLPSASTTGDAVPHAPAPLPPEAVPPAGAGKAATPSVERPTSTIARKRYLAIAGAVVVLLVLSLAGVLLTRRGPAAPTPSASPTVPPAAATSAPPEASREPAPPPVREPLPPPVSPPAPVATGRATPPRAAGREKVAGTPSTAPAPKPAPAPAPDPDPPRDAALPAVTFTNLRIPIQDGDRVREHDATATFAAGVLTVTAKNGSPLRTIAYDQILNVYLSRGRHPTWQTPGGGSVPVMRIPGGAFGMFRSDSHWLAIRTKEAFVVLRLEPAHLRTLPAAFADRAGVQVTAVRSSGR